MQKHQNNNIDWLSILLYILFIGFGLLNIFSTVYETGSIFRFELNSTKQVIWIGFSFLIIVVILAMNHRFYETFAYIIYGMAIFALIAVLVVGKEIKGARSWFAIGGFTIQPSEFAKFATALALAKFLSIPSVNFKTLENIGYVSLIIGVPMLLVLMQGDAGSAMVFLAFVFVLYREGLPTWIPLTGLLATILFVLTLVTGDKGTIVVLVLIALTAVIFYIYYYFDKRNFAIVFSIAIAGLAILYIFSVDYIFYNVLKPHQRSRIEVLYNPDIDKEAKGVRYNLKQSKTAFASGGVWGKGFMQGTQTKGKYVPEQSTDFIFCTVGEEYGLVGSTILISFFMIFIIRIILISEKQKDTFVRVYGFSVAGIFFLHVAVNISMTLGLFPVVGIPLPFFSYGGSSLWGFTILLFIFIKITQQQDRFERA